MAHSSFARNAMALLLFGATSCVPRVFPEDRLPIYEERPVIGLFSASTDEVWESVVEVMSQYDIFEVDADAKVLETDWNSGPSDYIYNTFSGTKIPEKAQFRMTAKVEDRNGRAQVTLLNHEQVEKDVISANLLFTGSVYRWIDVPSSSKKEREVLRRVEELL
jgi:hypothetical protein